MATITISLVQGQNFISFPAIPTIYTTPIKTILLSSTEQIIAYKVDPIISKDYVLIDDFEPIEKGRGYSLITNNNTEITYDGDYYYMTFDSIKAHILRGWNLIGTGNSTITSPTWCTVRDPMKPYESEPIQQLEPRKAYLIHSDDCTEQVTSAGSSAMKIITTMSAILFTYYLLREFSIVGKPINTSYNPRLSYMYTQQNA